MAAVWSVIAGEPWSSSFITVRLSRVLQSTEMKRSLNYRLGRKSCFQVLTVNLVFKASKFSSW